jgi:hypothetical protein
VLERLSEKPISTDLRTTSDYATFEDRGNSYVWTREEHDPNAGPDVLLNLSVSIIRGLSHQRLNLRFVRQLLRKSRGSSVVCGRVIEGRVLELYRELSDSPTNTLEETCILSAIFALRYLSRDLAANVEQIDVSFPYDFSRSCTDGRSSQYWKFGDGQKRFDPSQKSPSSPL